MGWNGTQIKAFVSATAGKLEPLALAAEVFANINTSDLARSTVAGPPTTGNWEVGEIIIGPDDVMWLSIEAGSPGVWVSSSGTVYPTTTFLGKPAEPVADIAALKAVPVAEREDKQERLVEALGTDWRFDSASTLTGDDVKVIAPTVGTGRWILVEEEIAFTSVKVVAKNGKTAAQGATGSFDKPYSTVAEGLAALTSGGLLLVNPGTYTETAPLTSAVSGTVIRSLGGAVVITVSSGKVGVLAASRNVILDGNITVQGIADSNAIELADGGGGAATTLGLKNGAAVASAGTGHAIAVLGKGTLTVYDGAVTAAGTGNGINLAGATSNLVFNGSRSSASSVGGLAINQAAASTCSFYGPLPLNCSFAGTVAFYPATGFTKTVYVSKNGAAAAAGADGTPERPFLTVTAALAALATGGTVMIAEGTYTEAASMSPASNTTLMALGGPVTITCATAVFTIAANRTLNVWGNISIVGPNNLNAVELADGATTRINLYNGASIASVGTGHCVAYAGQGIVLNNRGLIAAGATGNGLQMFNAAGSSYVGINSRVTAVGGLAINKPAAADCIFYGCTAPNGSTYTAGAGTVTVFETPMLQSIAFGALPAASTVPAGTVVRCTDFPTTEGSDLVSNGTKWVVKDFQPKPILALADADGPITAAQMLANDVLDATAMLAARTYTTATAAELVAAFAGAAVGTGFEFSVDNPTALTAFVAAGVGVTLVGSGAVLAGTRGRFVAKFTNVTALAEAVTIYRLQTDTSAIYAFANLPAAAALPANTRVHCSDRPVAKFRKSPGAMIYTDGAVWRYVADGSLVTGAERKTFLEDDFNTVVPIALYTDAEVVATGTAALQAGAAGDGELRLNIPAAADAVTHYFTQMSTNPARNPEIAFEGVTLSRITDIVAECGLRTAAGTDIVRFIFNTAVDGFWHYEATAVAGGTTNAATAVAPAAATPQNLRFVLTSATSVAFYIGDVLVGTAAVAANIPAVLMTPYFRAIGLAAAINGTVDFGRVRLDLDA